MSRFSIGLALVSLLTVSLAAWGQSQKSEQKQAEVDIQWSTSGDKDGLLSGLRIIRPESELMPGQPLVVEYRLTNVSKETKKLKCYLNKGMQFTSLSHGNRISGYAERQREPVTIEIEPGGVFIDQEHLVSIDTTGLEPGKYHAALGSGFYYSDSLDPNVIHEIPHRGSIPFTIVGESTLKIIELPKSDIHWGTPIAGLQVGAKFVGDPNAIAIGESVEADLFVANVTSQPIECSVALPHISHGWLFSVMDSNGSAIDLDGPFPLIHSPFPERRVIPFTLAPGEVSPITVDELSLRSRPSFATSRTTQRYLTWPSGADLAGSTTWPKYSIYSLMTQGGAYSATFHVTLIRPELLNLRLELDSGSVPFYVGRQEQKPVGVYGTADLKDEDVAAFVHKTLTKPYRPSLGGGSWQLGAHEYTIILTLESIPQQQLVADALMKKIEFSFGSDDTHARKMAMEYCAQNFPDRLLPYLVRRLSGTDFPDPNLSTIAQAFPSYYELTILGDLGEQGKAAIPALMKHLSAGDPIAREATIQSLVRVGPSDPEVMQSLSKCFNDTNVRVQGTAVYQAGRYGELAKPLGPKFVELLQAKSKEVQFWAAAALITSEFNPNLGFERLLAGAKTGERKDRRQALIALAMLGARSTAVTPELRPMLNDTDPEVVREVRETIRRIETNGRIVTHAEESVKRNVDRKRVALVREKLANIANTGALKGRITLDGTISKLPKLRVPTPTSPRLSKRATEVERKKYEASLVEIDDESLQVGGEQGLAQAFVYLAKAPSNWQPTQEELKPFTLTIQDYRFAPRAAIVRTGQDVRLNNSSVGDDNFAFEPMKNEGQNRAVGARAEITLEHPFTIPERIPIQAKSQIHPWKTTFLLLLDHPFAAITDSHGNFSIEGLPPGEHSFLIWHERTGWLEKSFVVRIEAGQTTSTDRAFSVDRFQ